MEKQTMEKLRAYNRIYKETDIVYHNYAKNCGLSDTSFWILYSLSESDELFTQHDFCYNWSFPPQTVNSALKNLEKQGVIYFEPVPGNKKNKWIKLTEKGTKLAVRVITPLICAECESFGELSREECDAMISTAKKYNSILKNRIENMF